MSDRVRELSEAIEQARLDALPPYLYIPFPTSLRSDWRPKPPQQLSVPVSGDIVVDPGPEYPPAISEAPTVQIVSHRAILPTGPLSRCGRQALDISIWRTRWFWGWRRRL